MGGYSRRVRSLFKALRPLAAFVNPLVLPLAGGRLLPLCAVLEHRGRRSGRRYRIPVYALRVPDGFVVPLVLGEEADWCRNVRAARGAALLWRGRRYALAEPAVIAPADAPEAFAGPLARGIASVAGIDSCVRFRVIGST